MKDEQEYRWVMWGLGMGLVLSLVAIWLPDFAWAADKDWVAPAKGVIDSLQSGLVQIGVPLIGVGIIGFGIWGALSGRIDWQKLAMIFVAGLLVTAGPEVISLLLPSK